MTAFLAPTPFIPHPFLQNPHLMTVAQQFQFRSHLLRHLPLRTLIVHGNAGPSIKGWCHWQPNPRQALTVILLHGLEGSSESSYMVGIAHKTWKQGWNVIRLDLGHEGTTGKKIPFSLSHDPGRLRSVIHYLLDHEGITDLSLVGYSMGGNLALRVAGQDGGHQQALRHIIAVSPPIDPVSSLQALEAQENWMYNRFLVRRFNMRIREQVHEKRRALTLHGRSSCNSVRGFLETYGLRETGIQRLHDYLNGIGATQALEAIRIPTLIVAAQDDPLVPFDSFQQAIFQQNPFITLISPQRGGHCSFIQSPQKHEDLHWAENRAVDFLKIYRAPPFKRASPPASLLSSYVFS